MTMWFYGTLPEPTQDREWNRTKQFTVSELLLLEEVHAGAKAFIWSAGLLPFMDIKRLRAEATRWDSNFGRARELIVRCSPSCQGFLRLLHGQKMPYSVARESAEGTPLRGIVPFWEESA